MRHAGMGRRIVLLCWLGCAAAASAQTPPVADLGASKSGPATTSAGSVVTYTIGVGNFGPDAAASVTLTDPLPAGMTFFSLTQTSGPTFNCTNPGVGNGGTVTCTLDPLPAGASASFDLAATIDAGTPPGTIFTNIATATTQTTDPNSENDSAVAVTSVPTLNADVYVDKQGPSVAGPNTDITYSLSIGNAGPDAAISAGFSDTLPGTLTFVSLVQDSGPAFSCTTGAVVDCSIGSLPSGAGATFTLVAHVPAGTPSGTSFQNRLDSRTETADNNAENNSASALTTISSVDIGVTKTAPPTVVAGQTLDYTITISNGGGLDTATGANFVDTLPPFTSFVSFTQNTGPTANCQQYSANLVGCTMATLPSGASATFTLSVLVDVATPNGTSLNNSVSAGSNNFDANPANNSASASTTASNTVDLAVTKSGPATAIAGSNASYAIGVTNNGPDVAANVTLSDALPANTTFVSLTKGAGAAAFTCTTPAVGAGGNVSCSVASLTAGASANFTLVLAVGTGLANGSSLSNTANVGTSSTDANAGNNSATTSATVNNTADLAVSKTAPANIGVGQNLSYTLTVANNGVSPANSVQLSDSLPTGTTFVSFAQNSGPAFVCTTPTVGGSGSVGCSLASLAPAASASFTLVVNVSGSVANGTVLTNTASAATSTTESNPANNSASANTTVTNAPDLAVTKTAPANIGVGQNLSYTLGVSNIGVSTANTVQLSDALPAGTTFVSFAQNSGPAFACTTPTVGGTGAVSCTVASLAAGASANFTLVVNVAGSVANGTVLANTAIATTASTDVNPANNNATANTTVSNAPDLALTKTAPASVNVGQNLTYTLTLANSGVSPANTVQLSDTLPTGTTFVSLAQNSGPAFACATPAVGGTGTVSCTLASLAAGASATFTLVVSVATSVANGTVLVNTATATTASVDVNPANNSATASTTVSSFADLAVTKAVVSSGAAGVPLVYTLGIANNGTAAAATVQLTDVLPTGTGFTALAQNSGPTFTCTTPPVGSGGSVICSIASLAAGASASFTLTLDTRAVFAVAVSNTVTATTATQDANVANNSATANVVLAAAAPIPTLDTRWLALLALLLAGAAALYARKTER